jgi:hypothetical protein
MPAKRKIDPAQQQEQFELWKASDEYNEWNFLNDSRTEVTTELLIDISEFLKRLHRFLTVMKVAHKSTSYEQLILKVAFFPKPENTNEMKMNVDNKIFEFSKAAYDAGHEVLTSFVQITNSLVEITKITAEEYMATKKEMTKKLASFEKAYMAFIKKGYDTLLAVLNTILSPLNLALEANMNWYYVQYRAHDKRKWFKDPAPDFRIKAVKQRFADTMTDLIALLKDTGAIHHVPNVMKSLSRLEVDTSTHDALKFFVSPVKKAWFELKKVMKETFRKGAVLMRFPIKENVEVVEAVKHLLDVELKADLLLGDPLKKDQLEFLYDVLNHILRSPFHDRLKSENKDSNDVIKTDIIPQLATFKALQQMYQVKEDIDFKRRELEEVGLELVPLKPDTSISFSLDKEVRYEGIKRMWIWESYIRDSDKPEWEQASEVVSKINLMVQEDIADFLIARHLKIRGDHKQDDVRPPYVWNHYLLHNRYVEKAKPLPDKNEIIEEKKVPPKFRQFANPKDSYRDGRVEAVIEKIETLSFGLKSHASHVWQLLVDNLIEAIKHDKPDSGKEDISSEEEEAKDNEENKEMQGND